MYNCKRLLTLQPVILFVLLISSHVFGQVKWDGEAGDGRWITARNWKGDVLPAATDNVILDNSFTANSYTVTLPAGDTVVTIRSISIVPGAGNAIELVLPAASIAFPAFKTAGTAYGMIIGNGGVFRNASGAPDGNPVEIGDSLKINNGGRFIQNSRRSHTAVVTVLSCAPGTENGIFEFDIPAASNTLSLSGRTYGKLVLSSSAMNGAINYTGTGINTIHIRSDLVIAAGVTLSLNFSDTLFIGRDLIQQGGVVNLGNSTRKLVTAIGGNLVQSATGTITRSGTALPEIVFYGNSNQQIDCKGLIKDSIAFTMHNAAGATLASSLALPYQLRLVKGKITTTNASMLTLLPGCRIVADSLADNSFIEGPLRIESLANAASVLCPVGKGSTMGWLALKNATGSFTVEYLKQNPRDISIAYGSGIQHISTSEAWTVLADAGPAPAAAIELSFRGPNNGVGTDLSTFRIARLSSGVWTSAGNTGYTGNAGANGAIVSNVVNNWSTAPEYFTLGNSEAANGALPLREEVRNAVVRNTSAGNKLQLLSVSTSMQPVLTYRAAEKEQVALRLVGMNGAVVTSIRAVVERGVNKLPVRTTSLPAGLYSIQAVTSKGLSNTVLFVSGLQ